MWRASRNKKITVTIMYECFSLTCTVSHATTNESAFQAQTYTRIDKKHIVCFLGSNVAYEYAFCGNIKKKTI